MGVFDFGSVGNVTNVWLGLTSLACPLSFPPLLLSFLPHSPLLLTDLKCICLATNPTEKWLGPLASPQYRIHKPACFSVCTHWEDMTNMYAFLKGNMYALLQGRGSPLPSSRPKCITVPNSYPEASRSLTGFQAQMNTSDSWPRRTVALLGGISTSPSISIGFEWLSAKQTQQHTWVTNPLTNHILRHYCFKDNLFLCTKVTIDLMTAKVGISIVWYTFCVSVLKCYVVYLFLKCFCAGSLVSTCGHNSRWYLVESHW